MPNGTRQEDGGEIER